MITREMKVLWSTHIWVNIRYQPAAPHNAIAFNMEKRDSCGSGHNLFALGKICLNWAKPVAPTCWEANFASPKRGDHDVLLYPQVLGYIHQLDSCFSINPLWSTKIEQFGFCRTNCLDYLHRQNGLRPPDSNSPVLPLVCCSCASSLNSAILIAWTTYRDNMELRPPDSNSPALFLVC